MSARAIKLCRSFRGGEKRAAGVTRDDATRVLFLCAANAGDRLPPPAPRRGDVFKQRRPRLEASLFPPLSRYRGKRELRFLIARVTPLPRLSHA